MRSLEVDVVDLFSGCGGMSVGFERSAQAGLRYRILCGVDIDEHANATYEKMLSVRAFNLDVATLLSTSAREDLLRKVRPSDHSPLIVIGGPPCQGFSAHRKKDPRTDTRNSLIRIFVEVATSLHPEFVVIENVPELFDEKHWAHYHAAKAVLEERGYRVRARVYNLADFGVPQARFRALVIARRAAKPFDMPSPPGGEVIHRTVRDAIGRLRPIAAGQTDPDDPMHIAPNHTTRVLDLIASIPKDGGSRRHAKLDLLPKCHGSVDGFRDVYGRLAWDKPSISITAKCSTPSSGRFLHPDQHRNITVREAALLQGFPEDYYFCGPLVQKYRQIGNAVPPLFAQAVASHLAQQMSSAKLTDDPAQDINQPLTKSFASSIAGIKKTASRVRLLSRLEKPEVELAWPTRIGEEPYSLIDCFCGAGGLSLGLETVGFHPVYAFDHFPYAVKTYRANISTIVEDRDASHVTPGHVLQRTGLLKGQCTLVAGGPPCQGFSQQRRGADDDQRNSLVLWFGDLVLGIRPTFFLLENVTYLTAKRGRRIFDQFWQMMTEAGYMLHSAELDASLYGVAQRRRRTIVIGHIKLPGLRFTFPQPQVKRPTTVREVIGMLPPPPPDGDCEHPDYANHQRAKITKINEIRISHVPPGGGWQDIPEHLQLSCHQRHRGQGHIDVYGRLDWEKPARTITALCDSFTRGQYAHPVENRPITAREAAALQSFPHSFRFFGPKKDIARQIGNAVPPLLAAALGQSIVRALQERQQVRAVDTQTLAISRRPLEQLPLF